MSLKEVLHAVKDVASSQAWVVKFALENWLEAVDQLPQPFSNPHTEATMQAAQKACRQAPPDWEAPTSLAWLQQYIPDITTAIANQLDEQYHIIEQRLDVLQKLCATLMQSSVQEQHHDSRQLDTTLDQPPYTSPQQPPAQGQLEAYNKLTARICAEGKACALLQCAAEAYRELGAVTALLGTIRQLEGLAAASQHGHQCRRLQIAEVELTMCNLSNAMLPILKRCHKARDVWNMYSQLAKERTKASLAYVSAITRQRSAYLVTSAAAAWMSAAVIFPAQGEKLQLVSQMMLYGLVDWVALLHLRVFYNLEPRQDLGDLMCSALARKHLRAHLMTHLTPQVIGSALRAYKVTSERIQELGLPEDAQQELLSTVAQAVGSYKNAANAGGSQDPAAAGSNNDAAAYGSDCGTATAGTQTDATKAGGSQDTATADSNSGSASAGSHISAGAAGSHIDTAAAGSNTDAAVTGADMEAADAHLLTAVDSYSTAAVAAATVRTAGSNSPLVSTRIINSVHVAEITAGTGTPHKGPGEAASSGVDSAQHTGNGSSTTASSSRLDALSKESNTSFAMHRPTGLNQHAAGCGAGVDGLQPAALAEDNGESSRGEGVPAAINAGLGDMQELLHMMYGLSSADRDAA